jgi:predicted MFS family arabinose efflux permease
MGALRARLAGPSLVLFACLFASQAGLLVLSPILPDVAREFGVSTAAAGQLRTLSGLAGGVTAVLLALAPRRAGLRRLLTGGAAFVAVGSGLSAAAPTFAVLAGAQALVGVGVGLLVAIGIAAAGDWTEPAERARTLAWAIAGMPVAWVVGMPIVGATAAADWRLPFVAVPAAAGLVTLVLLRLRPADRPSTRTRTGAATWRRPGVARFAGAELLANAGWAAVLTYSGSLLVESYGASATTAAAGLALMAAAMVPGTFLGRRGAARATRELLAALTLSQAAVVVVLGAVRPAPGVSLGLLAVMAFTNGPRTMIASSLGMDSAPADKVTVMALRAAANQFGYLLGGAAGGLALATGGFPALGLTLAGLFVFGAVPYLVRPRRPAPRSARGTRLVMRLGLARR